MTARPDEIVMIARSWIGTPYCHQGSRRSAGTDCLGLVRGVWRELLGKEPGRVPNYSADWSEPQREEVLWRAAAEYLKPKDVNARQPGDVLLFRMREGSVAKHLAIAARLGAMPTMIHAYQGHGVVETPLSAPWARRVVACFSFPEEVY